MPDSKGVKDFFEEGQGHQGRIWHQTIRYLTTDLMEGRDDGVVTLPASDGGTSPHGVGYVAGELT